MAPAQASGNGHLRPLVTLSKGGKSEYNEIGLVHDLEILYVFLALKLIPPVNYWALQLEFGKQDIHWIHVQLHEFLTFVRNHLQPVSATTAIHITKCMIQTSKTQTIGRKQLKKPTFKL